MSRNVDKLLFSWKIYSNPITDLRRKKMAKSFIKYNSSSLFLELFLAFKEMQSEVVIFYKHD